MAVILVLITSIFSLHAQTITNLRQLTETLDLQPRAYGDLDLRVTVCAVSRPEVGVLIARDETGTELLELGNIERNIVAGERIHLRWWHCLFRKRELGVQISQGPVVDNDGLHIHRTWGGNIDLKEGLNPLQLDWFNCLQSYNLEVYYAFSNAPVHSVDSSNLWHAVVDTSGHTNFMPGLRAICYEGYWEKVPDFNLFQPVKTGIVTNFDLGFRARDERIGIRFTGYLKVPCDGQYHFHVRSDDGSLLYLGRRELPITRLGFTDVPPAATWATGETMSNLNERVWMTVAGRVSFISQEGHGFELEMHSGRDVLSVRVADAAGLEPSRLLNVEVKVTGIGRAVLTENQRVVLGELFAASAKEIVVQMMSSGVPSFPITSVEQVRSLPVEAARRALPVRIRGVVTDAKNNAYLHWISIQDDTRGIFVNLGSATNAPAFGENWVVEGHTAPGDFAPIIVADKLTFLGDGQLPEPARPTWNELLNGSMDAQWAELKGLVTDVHTNLVTLMLPEGRLNVLMDGYAESDLRPFLTAIVQIRGVLYAIWNAQTREVRVGNVMMRNPVLEVDTPAPANSFDAVLKTPRELRLFDPKATTFRRVKVRGQIIYADASEAFLEEDGVGLRLLPAGQMNVNPGDLVDAVGYPDISRAALLMRQVIVRKVGQAALPVPKKLASSELARDGLDYTRVRVEGKLLGWHSELDASVLEIQSGAHLYLARLAPRWAGQLSLRIGSRLALNGVYVGKGHNGYDGGGAQSIDLLLNSPADIEVLSQPSWWTLQRLLILVGMLLVILVFTAIWITQLRRLVEHRTHQLQYEIRERERIQRQHALEAERSRIARDLHDDLGSSLTEISVLANTGQRHRSEEGIHEGLFQAIANKARQLVAALDVIVWAVDPEDNSLQSLADYLTGYTGEFFSHTIVSCRFKVPVAFPQITLQGRVRHDLLMAVKETLNNVARHAQATEVEFRMAIVGGNLEIEIADNGKGFEGDTDGHGLKNLSARLLKSGGTCTVESRVGGGTSVKIRLPLPSST